MFKKIKKLFTTAYYRVFYKKWDVKRLLLAMARLRDGCGITPCVKGTQNPITKDVSVLGIRTWKESFTKENNTLILWYNLKKTTKIVYFPMELCK